MDEGDGCTSSGSSSEATDDSPPQKDCSENLGKAVQDAAAMFTRSRKRSVHVKRIEPNAVQEMTAQVAEETVQKEARLHDAQGFQLVDDDARREDLHRINIALHTSTHGTFLFLSNDKWRWAWEGLLLLVACYYALIVPVKIVYSNSYLGDLVLAVEIPTTLILVFDIFLQFNTSYSQNGTMVTNKAAIRRHYFTTWFVPELLASAPFDLVLYVLLPDAETDPAFKCLSALRLIRVCTLQRVFMDNDAESLSMAQVWITYLAAPLLRLIVWVVLCIHWLSLLRVYLLWDDSESEAALTGGRNYLTAMYWVTYTLTTVGYGDVMVRKPSERILAIVLFVTGALLNAATIGGVAQMLSRSNAKNERNDNMRATLALLRHYNVSAVLAEETLSFKQHQLKSFGGANAHAVLRDLPPELSEDIGVYIKVKFIALAPIFDAASSECRTELAKALRPECAPLHTTIVSEGEEATDMYFLAHGFADQVLVCEDRSMSRILKKGDFFGEASLLLGRSESTVHALTYCELYTLSKDDFHFILEEFPDFRNIMQERIKAAEEEIKHFARADIDFSATAGRRQSTTSRTGWVTRPRWDSDLPGSTDLSGFSVNSRPTVVHVAEGSEASQRTSKAGFRNMLNRPPALATASNAAHNAQRDSVDSASWLGMKRAVDLIDEIAASPRVARKQSRDAPPTRKIIRPSTRQPPVPLRPAERACVTDELFSPSAASVATAWSPFACSPRAVPAVHHDNHDNHSSSQTKPDIAALLAASQETIMAAIEASEDRIRTEFISLLRSPVPVGDPLLQQ